MASGYTGQEHHGDPEAGSSAAQPTTTQPDGNQPFNFVVYDSSGLPNQNRRDVRSLAAKSCAAKRKATIERRMAERLAQGYPRPQVQPPDVSTPQNAALLPQGQPPDGNTPRHAAPLPPVLGPLAHGLRNRTMSLGTVKALVESSLPIDPAGSGLDQTSSYGRNPVMTHYYPTPAATPDEPEEGRPFLEVFAASLSSRGQATLPLTIWEAIMRCGALYQTLMLIASSHRQPPIPISIRLWLRQDAMRSVMAYVHQMNLADEDAVAKALASIALLANWEDCFGDKGARDMHFKGLQQILRRQQPSGLSEMEADGVRTRLGLLTDAIAQNGAALALITFKDSFSILARTIDTVASPLTASTPVPAGFAALQAKGLIDNRVVQSLVQLSCFNINQASSGLRLRRVMIQLAALSSASPEDKDIPRSTAIAYQEAHAILRLAGLQLCIAYFECNASKLNLDFILDVEEGKKTPVNETAILRPELLVNSPYADLAIWGTAIISGVSGCLHPHHIKGLQLLFKKRGINRFKDFDEVLSRFFYPREYVQARCGSVWEQSRPFDSEGYRPAG